MIETGRDRNTHSSHEEVYTGFNVLLRFIFTVPHLGFSFDNPVTVDRK